MTFAQYEMQNFGYKVITTFFEDFCAAELLGQEALEETFNASFEESKEDYKQLTELVIVLNTRCWIHHEAGHRRLCGQYADWYYQVKDYASENLTAQEYDYFFHITD